MKHYWLPAIALFALTAKAQNINFSNVPHIHTALNHLTVIDLGEPVQFIAAGNPDSFQIERAGDKVLLQPLKDAASTDLILWTTSREVSYELDTPGDVAEMNVLVRNLPPSAHPTAESPTLKERQQAAAAATTKALLDTQDVIPDRATKLSDAGIEISIVRVLHTDGTTYLEYKVVNHSATPFRVTVPTITRLAPTQIPVSLLALRNHQLSLQTLSDFKAKPDGAVVAVDGQSLQTDLLPGSSTKGFVLFKAASGSTPEIYNLDFGASAAGSLVETVVI